ncbi:SPASM domain-containing protein [Eggerthia catenaformis]|uniref:SPASM domain-containing protein n=1 Tax=Eggerthia catenaformis TaxID=31973 RepID=UPI0036F2E043
MFWKLLFKLNKCSAGYESISLFPDGNLFPCHAFVQENKKFQLVNLTGDNSDLKKVEKELEKSEEKCKNCWCEYLCIGCPQSEMHESSCKEMKSIYEKD